MPHERSHVIIDRPPTTSLEINEIRFTIPDHDIAWLEVPVHEGRNIRRPVQKVQREAFEVILKQDLVEFQTRRLQKTVFEIIQVEHHHTQVKLRLRIAYEKVKALGSFELKPREHGHGPAQKFLRRLVKEDIGAKIFLDVAHLVLADRKDVRDIQSLGTEMPRQGNEGMVLRPVKTDDTDACASVG